MRIRPSMKRVLGVLAAVAVASVCSAETCSAPESIDPWPTAGNCIYDVVLNSATAAFSAGTGIDHPVTRAMFTDVMGGRETLPWGGGRYLQAFERAASLRSWTSGVDYLFADESETLLDDNGFRCEPVRELPAPVITAVRRADGQVVGLSGTTEIDENGDRLAVTVRIVARGETYEDSAVELTVTLLNLGSGEARLGLREAWAVGMVGAGAAALVAVPPDPPVVWSSLEGEWDGVSFDHVLAAWTNAPTIIDPYYFGGISINGPWPLVPAPTPPDVIVRSSDVAGSPPEERAGIFNTCFAWEVPDPPRGGGNVRPGQGSLESLAYYWGRTEDRAIPLGPGEERSFTTWSWAFIDNPVTCDAGPPQVVECAGAWTPVELDGTASSTPEGSPLLFRWSSPDPAVGFDAPTAPRPVAWIAGLGHHEVTLEVGVGPYTSRCTKEVDVIDTTPPRIAELTVQPAVLWPPNHRLRSITVHASTDDRCDTSPSIRLISVTSSEPDDAVGLGDGRTVDDMQDAAVGTDDRDVLLRAERDGSGTGRQYTLTYEATDASGNAARRSVSVTVPHDARSGTALPRRPRSPHRP